MPDVNRTRTYAHVDLDGTIHAFVSVDAPGKQVSVVTGPGLTVAELAGVHLSGSEQDVEKLRAMAVDHVLATPVAPVRLVRKDAD